MDGFLGTSIQYSEQQILLLEQQHAANLEKTVQELISSGFLDSDYEEYSTDYSTESEYTENELPSDIEKEMTQTEENMISKTEENEINTLQLFDNYQTHISPPIATHAQNNNDLSLQIPSNHSQDLIECKAIEYLLAKVLTDIKSLMILFILMIALPHIIENNAQNNSSNTNANIYNTHYSRTHTSVYWFYDITVTNNNHDNHNKKRILNEEEDERDEYQRDIEQCNQCNQCSNNYELNKHLIFDIMAATLDTNKINTNADTHTHTIFSAKVTHHQYKWQFVPCQNDNKYIAPDMPPLILSFGAGIKCNEMTTIVKQILSNSMGKQFAKTHGLIALIMSFAGIAAFAATNNNQFTINFT